MKDLDSELFNYTTGRFLANEALCLRERRRVFDIPGLCRIIAKALHLKTEQIVGFTKLGEGGFNRIFLITIDIGFQLVARIPYPILTPKAYALASEVATMDFLRSKGLPIPKVYAYSFMSDNEAMTEYSNGIWFDLKEDQIISFMDQLAKFESIMMSISFPAGGSICYAKDLKELSGNEGITLNENIEFCIGPDIATDEDAKSVMVAGANKELAYLDHFGSPRLPYKRLRRESYNYKKQPPSDHARNLRRYLHLVPWLVPDNDSISTFCIRHPDLSHPNLMVSTHPSGLHILSMLDWQHAAILPLFLHAGMPEVIQNEEDEVSRSMVKPKLPVDFDKLSGKDQEWEMELLRRRLVHYHYNLSTATYNRIHFEGFVYPLNTLRHRIFLHATALWEGETINLLYELIDVVLNWESFEKDGTPCPVVFTKDEKAAAQKLYQGLMESERFERLMMDNIGYAEETWVPVASYEKAKEFCQKLKQRTLDGCKNNEVTAEIEANWPFDDMDEEDLEEYK
ncbi:hypothetical protein H0H87_009786 [Tephrocybe sp. NHM501043]|nr:hypothetical protein H0H87_009786 [Tephrocybe sp. NHM501043]